MKKRKCLSILLISSLAVTFFLGGSSICLGQEKVAWYSGEGLAKVNPEDYLKLRGKIYAKVEMDTALEPERTNLPMTPHWKPVAPPWTIGWSDITTFNPWRVMVTWEGKYEASKHPDLIKNFYQTEAGGDISKQIADIETLIAKKVDALIICPGSPSALVPVIEKAYDMGIPVIVFHGRVNTEKFTCSIQPDEYGMGFLSGDWLGKQLNGKGKIIGFKALPGYQAAIDRWNGALAGIGQYPEIKLLGAEFSWWEPTRARKAATDLLAAHPDFEGVLSIDCYATAAVIELLAAAGRSFVPMTGFEDNDAFGLRKKYNVPGIGSGDPTYLGAEAVKAAKRVLQGQPIYKYYLAKVPIITGEDMDRLYRPDMPGYIQIGTHLPEEIMERICK